MPVTVTPCITCSRVRSIIYDTPDQLAESADRPCSHCVAVTEQKRRDEALVASLAAARERQAEADRRYREKSKVTSANRLEVFRRAVVQFVLNPCPQNRDDLAGVLADEAGGTRMEWVQRLKLLTAAKAA